VKEKGEGFWGTREEIKHIVEDRKQTEDIDD
jgi:hypothetical protein